MKLRKRSITRRFLIEIVLVTFLSLSIHQVLWIINSYKNFKVESKKIHQEFVNSQKELIRSEVLRTKDYVNFKRKTQDTNLKKMLINYTDQAYAVTEQIYLNNKGKISNNKIKQKIKEALRPIRFNNGRGYFWILRMDGVEELYPTRPEMEGKNLINLQDSNGKYVVREEIDTAREKGAGFVHGTWPKPNEDPKKLYENISYCKYFKPLNWIVGTGEFIDDFETEIQDQVLQRIEQIRFGEEGYIFVNTYEGTPLITDGKRVFEKRNIWDLTDPNGFKVIQAEKEAALKPEGDYIYYVWNKLSKPVPSPKVAYISGIQNWGWIIGAGVYLDEVDKIIAQKKIALKKYLIIRSLVNLGSFFVVFLIVVLISIFFSKKLKKEFEVFNKFFQEASHQNNPISETNLNFFEFKQLAMSANRMIKERHVINEKQKKTFKELELSYKKLKDAQSEIVNLERKNSAMAMAITASHEINQPLMIIKANLEMLLISIKEDQLTETQGAYLKSVIDASDRIHSILNKFLNATSIKIENYSDTTKMVVLDDLEDL